MLAVLGAVSASAAGERVVRFGVVGVEPLAFMEEGQPAGLFVELCQDVAAHEGWQLQFEAVSWEDGLRGLAAGELDLLPTVAYSAARDSILDFGSEHVLTLWSQVYLLPGTPIENVLDLAGRRVAVMRGDMNAQNFRELVGRFDVRCELVEFASLSEVFAAVRSGRAAAGVAPNAFGHTNAARFGLEPSPILFAPIPVYFATGEGRGGELLATLDESLRQWRADEDSYYFQRLHHWLGQGVTTTRLPAWVLPAILAILALALLLLAWNRALKRRVARHTRELSVSERKFRSVFEAAGDAIFLMRDERFVDCNQRALQLFRCQREEIIGRRPGDYSPAEQPDGRPSAVVAHERMLQVLAGGPVIFEWRHRRGDDTLFDAEVTLNTLELEGVTYLLALVRDVTRRKELEGKLRQAQKMEAIGTLAGGIAHDFNNILAAVMGYNELARADAAPGSEQASYLERIARGAERARDLVLQILAFSRRTAEVMQPMDLAPIVEESLKLLRSSIPTTIAIRQSLETPGRVLADPTAMHQVVMNLGTNAYQALAPDGGTLELRLRETAGNQVELAVTDDGPGMGPELRAKIFEPYFTTKETEQGTGLGLAVVHGIVEEHGGTIEVESSPGLGTTFTVRLPACHLPLPEAGEAGDALAAYGGGEHVMVVDDEAAIVDVFARGLRRLGYRVSPYTDPEHALAVLRETAAEVDVLVTDMTMPRLTGAALAQAALELNPRLKVLLCTGYSDSLTPDAARSLGVSELVPKPVDITALAGRIRMALAQATPRAG